MKTIGLLGGMSWESTLLYYRLLNTGVAEQLGGVHSARIAMYSVDFHGIEALQRSGNWEEAGRQLAAAALRVQQAGADFLIIATNTMHLVEPAISAQLSIPILHIADATGEEIRAAGISTVGLLGTGFTMDQDFYKGRLRERFGLRVLVPGAEERTDVHRIIFEELIHGRIVVSSRARYMEVIERFVQAGAEGVILGCTEIGMLVGSDPPQVPLFDTTEIPAAAAVRYALAD